MVVENGQGERMLPLAPRTEHLEGAVVKVEMPEGADLFRLEAADLALVAPCGSAFLAGVPGLHAGLAQQAMRLQVAAHGGIGAQRPQRRLGLEQRRQVVVVQLVGPVRVFLVLAAEPFGHGGRQ
jgi:hypothetical protein